MKLFNKIKIAVKNSEYNELLRGSSSALFMRITGYILGYVLTFFIAKKFGATVLGNYIFAVLICNFLSLFSSFGIDTAVLAHISSHAGQGKNRLTRSLVIRAYTISLISGIIFTMLIYVLSGQFSILVKNAEIAFYLRILAFSVIPLGLIKINAQILRSKNNIPGFVFYNDIVIYLFTIVLLLMLVLFSGATDFPVPVSYSVGMILSLLLSLYSINKYLTGDSVKHEEKVSYSSLIRYSFPVLISDILRFIKIWTGAFLLGVFLGQKEVGIFSISLKLAGVAGIFTYAISSAVMPKFGEYFGKNDFHSIQRLLNFSGKLIFWVSFPVIIVIIIFSFPVLNLLGKDFHLGFPALLILSAAQVIEVISGTANYLLQMVYKQKIYFIIISISTIFLVILSFILIPLWGINGAALAYSLGMFLQVSLLLIYIRKYLNLSAGYFPIKIK
jgi:O-antigen/teichoic acid export membrane protein